MIGPAVNEAARLTDVAKGRAVKVLASSETVRRAARRGRALARRRHGGPARAHGPDGDLRSAGRHAGLATGHGQDRPGLPLTSRLRGLVVRATEPRRRGPSRAAAPRRRCGTAAREGCRSAPIVSSPMGHTDLLDLPLDVLMSEARRVRDAATGTRVTYSPKVFIPLTMLCRDRCGYCTFAQPPARLESPVPRRPTRCWPSPAPGPQAGCHEALFTLGERPEERYPVARRVAGRARLRLDRRLPGRHVPTGARRDRPAPPRQRRRPVRRRAGGAPRRRPQPGDDGRDAARRPRRPPRARPTRCPSAGWPPSRPPASSAIPFTTGILVGIGEDRADRLAALEAIAAAHRRHGHVQEVIVQNFLPKPGTAMHRARRARPTTTSRPSRSPALVLPPDVHVQAPPNLTDDFGVLLDAGIDDWGGVSPVTADHVNPERPWPALDRLREVTEARGFALAPRLTIYPEFVARARPLARPRPALPGAATAPTPRASAATTPASVFPERTLRERQGRHRRRGRAHRRRSTAWYSGADADARRRCVPAPAGRAPRGRGRPRCSTACCAGQTGRPRRDRHPVRRPRARGRSPSPRWPTSCAARRSATSSPSSRNRNINYTNVCTFKCKFCGFSKGPLSLNLRGTPYLLTLDDIAERVARGVGARRHRGVPAGRHPPRLRRRLLHRRHPGGEGGRARHPRARLHRPRGHRGGQAPRRAARPTTCAGSWTPGCATLPGTAAEILDDDGPGRSSAPTRSTPTSGSSAHRTAHPVGLRSNVTIMFGAVESPAVVGPPPAAHPRPPGRDRRLHRVRRRCRSCTWPRRIYLQRKARRGPTFREVLLMHAVGPHRLPRSHRQHPGLVGEARAHGRDASCSRPAATTSAAR